MAFDLLALGDTDYMERPFSERRAVLEDAPAGVRAQLHITPATTDRALAGQWFAQFEGAGLDGLIAKPLDAGYEPDKRVMFKVKHERTADCVVAGYRTHKTSDEAIRLAAARPVHRRGQAGQRGRGRRVPDGAAAAVVRRDAAPGHHVRGAPVELGQAGGRRREAEVSRCKAGKDLSFVPLRSERVIEVRYDHMEGRRFRHTTQFVRWREDCDPRSCTYEQFEEPVSSDLGDILGDPA